MIRFFPLGLRLLTLLEYNGRQQLAERNERLARPWVAISNRWYNLVVRAGTGRSAILNPFDSSHLLCYNPGAVARYTKDAAKRRET